MKKLYVVATVFSLIGGCLTGIVSASPGTKASSKRVTGFGITNFSKGLVDTTQVDSVLIYDLSATKPYLGKDSLAMEAARLRPFVSVQQMLKGNIAGLYIQESSGEPGTIKQGVTVRGISTPVLHATDFNKNKPLIVVNGIPLTEDPAIVYDIQNYTIQPVGAATNINTVLDPDNIESIYVLKDYSTAAIYGPRAANGVIYITTKNASAGERRINVNGNFGFATPSSVSTINGEFEKNFRKPFYDRYADILQQASYPAYLSDSSNVNYYGPSNWTDLYYKTSPIYSLNGSLVGGGNRSNFRFFAGHTSDAGAADAAKFKRYQGAFYINMIPLPWLTISSMIHATRLDRDRNKSIIERFGETRYVPDLSTPISPNKDMYGLYLKEYDKTIDENFNNSIIGYFSLNFAILKNLSFSPKLMMDYNENTRNVFWPSTLMSGNNYVSNYFGYNERMVFDNTLNYFYDVNDKDRFSFTGGFNYQADAQKYNYAQGYRGPNDFIKVNVVEGNSQYANYLQSIGFIPYYYSDKIQHRLASFYGKLNYTRKDEWNIGALIRNDGSSAVQPSERWFLSYAVNADYNLNHVIKSDFFDYFKVLASYGRLGNIPTTDRDAAGPQYASELGWDGNKAVFSYNGLGTLSRPYQSGWVGYDLPWSYTEMLNVGLDVSLLKNMLTARVDFYNKDNKDAIFNVPIVAESGYQFERKSGMVVNNKGMDLTLNFNLPAKNDFSWNSSFNISYNNNKLKALPNGLPEIEIGTRKLAVGERIDHFWLLQNRGIFNNDLDVPVNPSTYKILTYNGTDMKGGDPRWIDINGDYDINNKDRQLMGNIFPKYTGGFYNQFKYKSFDISAFLYFNLKKDILNSQAASYYDFANQDESNAIGAVRDITFWEKNFDDKAYPLYNPWSPVSPYQAEQDMFLEDGSFLKLRNLTVGYDMTKLMNRSKDRFTKFYVYVSGSNLWTLTKYTGRDPELVDFYGYDTGLGLRIPKTFILGVKMDL
ncbi:SusC/RagA family TonB-linked outer membrane protein [Sphingobacterium spiritivorum]|uniref:SusC/RagA family TonB-linked outer membrane protein n=1 Tax=Sphingobacterium spiritivorum TaxID=258 RepID=UPI00191A44EE|nr:SusC/RagA family TonB-linked outer membrane protein [Sphingobacterium spiritivorum]QQT24947.1 SusC/RagA family TonB-linked outer membrane protein [Sphingobacterium spiritivorum]